MARTWISTSPGPGDLRCDRLQGHVVQLAAGRDLQPVGMAAGNRQRAGLAVVQAPQPRHKPLAAAIGDLVLALSGPDFLRELIGLVAAIGAGRDRSACRPVRDARRR